MRTILMIMLTAGILSLASTTDAQQPGGKKDGGTKNGGKRDGGPGGPGGGGAGPSTDEIVKRMFEFDKNGDGKLTKEELGDDRLGRLFDRADANKDGILTKEELQTFFKQQAANGGPGGGGRGGRGGFGGPEGEGPGGPGGGFGGPGGPGGFGGFPKPGQVLPEFLQGILGLSADQKKDLATIQKEVDAKLEKILTPEQRKMLKDMTERGPGGPGGFGGGPGGPGGGRPPFPPKD